MNTTQSNYTYSVKVKELVEANYITVWRGEKKHAKENYVKLIGYCKKCLESNISSNKSICCKTNLKKYKSIRTIENNGIITIFVK